MKIPKEEKFWFLDFLLCCFDLIFNFVFPENEKYNMASPTFGETSKDLIFLSTSMAAVRYTLSKIQHYFAQ